MPGPSGGDPTPPHPSPASPAPDGSPTAPVPPSRRDLPARPVPPGPSRWDLTPALIGADPDDDLIAVGADLEPATLLSAYRAGLFPMVVGAPEFLGWWAPVERGVLEPDDLHISRSLRRSLRRFTVTVDRAFERVVAGCADPSRPGAWITPEFETAYARLHRLGWAHSIEVWSAAGLVGGLYGVAIGGLFAGESMFHTETDASKAAVAGLVDVVGAGRPALIDVQWQTAHLATLGISTVARGAYAARLPELVAAPGPDWPAWRARAWRPGSPLTPPPGPP